MAVLFSSPGRRRHDKCSQLGPQPASHIVALSERSQTRLFRATRLPDGSKTQPVGAVDSSTVTPRPKLRKQPGPDRKWPSSRRRRGQSSPAGGPRVLGHYMNRFCEDPDSRSRFDRGRPRCLGDERLATCDVGPVKIGARGDERSPVVGPPQIGELKPISARFAPGVLGWHGRRARICAELCGRKPSRARALSDGSGLIGSSRTRTTTRASRRESPGQRRMVGQERHACSASAEMAGPVVTESSDIHGQLGG